MPLNDGKWHHVVGTNDGTRLTIYLDGVKTECSAHGTVQAYTGDIIRVGKHPTSSNYDYDGRIEEVRVYNRALTHAEVLRLWAGVSETAGTVVHAASGNLTVSGTLRVGTGRFTLGAGTATFTSGGTVYAGGTLTTAAGAVSLGNTFTVDGTLAIGGGTTTAAQALTINAGGTLSLTSSSSVLKITNSKVLFSSTPALYRNDAGEVLLAVASSLEPTLRVLGGTDGGLRWSKALSARTRSSPVFANGRLFVATDAGILESFVSSTNEAPVPAILGMSPASGENVSGRVTLRWGAAFDHEGEVLRYQVRLDDDGEVLHDWDEEIITARAEQAAVVSDQLWPGRLYAYAVRAQDTRGALSAWSRVETFRGARGPARRRRGGKSWARQWRPRVRAARSRWARGPGRCASP